MQLQLATWPEVEAYLARSSGIIVPIGSFEQHGPTGLIGTDAICAEVIAARAGAEADILIGPTFNVGVAQHHMAFPGSMTLRPATFVAVIRDWVNSLAQHGFEKIYFLNGHGGNIATLNSAFAELNADVSLGGHGINQQRVIPDCVQQSWWLLPGIYDLCKQLYPQGHGGHATPSEVAVTQFAYPDHIKHVPLEPETAPSGRFTHAAQYREKFPDGRIGSNPALATPEDGERLVAAAVKALIADFRHFLNS